MTSFWDLMLRKKGAVLFAPDGSQSTRGLMTLHSCEPGGLHKSSVVVAVTNTSTSLRRTALIAHAARLAGSEDIVVVVFDVRRVYFYAKEKRDTFVELLDYVPAEVPGNACREAAQRMYGTRPAAASWGDELRKGLVSCILTVGTVTRCCFHNELCSVAGTVHGDDFFVAGPRQDVAKMGATLKKRWETRDQMIGPKPDDQKEPRILNRTLRWCKDGLVFTANLRHGREVVDEMGLSKSKPVSSPATGGWRGTMPE